MGRSWTWQEDAVVRYHYARGLAVADLAAALERGEPAVRKRANDLGVTRGTRARVVPTPNAKRPWTPADDDHLREWLGLRSHAQLARDLGRSPAAIKVRVTRQHIARAPNVLTVNEVARLFGVDRHLVLRWVRDGWLVARPLPLRCGGARRRMLAVDDASLERFIHLRPEAYPWRRIEPGYWRDLAEQVWRADPLLTVGEVARRLGLTSRNSVAQIIRRGDLAAVKGFGPNAPWYVRESALANYQPRPRGFTHQRRRGRVRWGIAA